MEPCKNTDKNEQDFRKIHQLPGETIDAFFTKLMQKAQFCDFHDAQKEVRLQLVTGTSSRYVQYKGSKNSRVKMPLKELMEEARAHELAKSESDQSARKEESVNFVKPSKPGRVQSAKSCWFCGGNYPHTSTCPAKGKTCNLCKKIGHFEKVCHSKKSVPQFKKKGKFKKKHYQKPNQKNIGLVQEHNVEASDEELYAVGDGKSQPPTREIVIGDEVTTMIVDSGCPRNIISSVTLSKFKRQPKLKSTDVKLYPFMANIPLPIRNKFKSRITVDNRTAIADVFVVDGDSASLLSRETSEALGILQVNMVSEIVDQAPNQNMSSSIKSIIAQYEELFRGIGKLKDYQVKLHVDNDIVPVAQPHRRVPYSLRKKIADKIQQLEDSDIIEHISGPTPWVSPVVCVPKANSQDIRLCVDMRCVNEAIQRERHITPTITEIIADVNGSRIFSKLDLNQGYHQLELHPDSRHLTTFSTHLGLRQYKRLNFGISCASEIFQNAISQVLEGIPGVLNVSDDIMIFSKSEEEHNNNLKSVLNRLKQNNLTLNSKKCQFARTRTEFFGFIFNASGMQADPKKMQAIVESAAPKSGAEVRSFLGMITYISRFIPNLATIAAPLRELTKKNQSWKWGEPEQTSFDTLKDIIMKQEVMAYFDPNKDTKLLVDASPVGMGAILTQNNRVISYASRAMSSVESRYSQTEREALAIYWGCNHFRIYLSGRHVEVVTDHKALIHIFSKVKSKPPPRIERWLMKLQDYHISVVYAPGKSNPADYMSRHPSSHQTLNIDRNSEMHINFVTDHSMPKAISRDEFRQATMADRTLNNVIKALGNGRWYDIVEDDKVAKSLFKIRTELSCTEDGILLRGSRIVVPESLQIKCVKLAHSGHQGMVKTKQLLRMKTWFSGIDKMAEGEVEHCLQCQANTPSNHREPLIMTPTPLNKWENLSMDFCGPLPTGEYLMVVIDDHSRYPEVDIIHSTSARAVIPRLDRIFAAHGVPTEIRTDNGPPFNGSDFHHYAETQGFHHRKVTPLHPEANGEAERFMKTLMKAIRVGGNQWRSELYRFLRAYRATPHSSTGVSPSLALNNREMNIGFPNVTPQPTVDEMIREKVINKDSLSKTIQRDYANEKRRVTPTNMDIGDSVLLRNTQRKKMDPPYNPDPFTIVKKTGSMVSASNGHSEVTRNSSHFKRIPTRVDVNSSQDITMNPENSTDVISGNGIPEMVVNDAPSQIVMDTMNSDSPRSRSRPQRSRKLPGRFKDYVTK